MTQPAPATQPVSSMATASLVLGIIGILVVPIVCSTLAIIFGAMEWSKQPEGSKAAQIDGRPSSWSRGRIGCILGIIGLSAWILLLAIIGQ